MDGYDEEFRRVLEDLIPGIPCLCHNLAAFLLRSWRRHPSWGTCVYQFQLVRFWTGGYITIGAYTLVGPNVQIYTPQHPLDYLERRVEQEYAYPVTIGEDCWIGGGAVICPE